MKKMKLLSLLLIGFSAAAVMTGCSKEEDAVKPTINVVEPGSSTNASTGSKVQVKVTASANVDLKTFGVTVSYDGGAATAVDITEGAGTDSTLKSGTTSFTIEDDFTTRTVAGTEVYTFKITDKNGNESTATLTVNVTVAGEVSSYTAKLLGAQSNSTEGSFFASSTGTVYLQGDAKANAALIDLLYFYGATNEATIAAPDDSDAGTIYNNSNTGLQTWSKKNATKFKAAASADFDNATYTSLGTEASGAAETKINKLIAGQIFAFVTESGKSGLVKVKSISGTQSGSITIDVKVQK